MSRISRRSNQLLKRFPWFYVAILISVAGCDSKPEQSLSTNPLDPENPSTGGDPFGLEVRRSGTTVNVDWEDVSFPGLIGYTVYRKSDRDSSFMFQITLLDGETRWTDEDPPFWTETIYRVTALVGDSIETDPTGRGADTLTLKPFFQIGTGASSLEARNVSLFLRGEDADSIKISPDSLFAGAEWEPFVDTREWVLSDGGGTKSLYALFMRDEGEISDTLTESGTPLDPVGMIEIAGGDSIVARAWLTVDLTGSATASVILSEDTTFGDEGDTVLTFDPTSDLTHTLFWQFDSNTLDYQSLYAQFINDFGVDTFFVDTIRPDSLIDVSISFPDTLFDDCTIPLTVNGVATTMSLTEAGSDETGLREPYRQNTFWTINDKTPGRHVLEVRLGNDFLTTGPVVLRDSVWVEFTRELQIIITDPEPESTVPLVRTGDTLDILGSIISSSCMPFPERVDVEVVGIASGTVAGGSGWLFQVPFDTVETSMVLTIIATTTDMADSTATDTIEVTVSPVDPEAG